MSNRILAALMTVVVTSILGFGKTLAQDGSTLFFPEKQTRLYQTHHGEPAGYPGCLPGELNAEGKPKYPRWGNPQVELYPGSVEHYRGETQKYVPTWPMFEATSLVKNFRLATDLPKGMNLSIEDYAEPVYYVPMYGATIDTGKRNPPVKVVRMKAGSPVINLKLGELSPSLYCLRLIGAAETPHTQGIRKPVYVELTINDGPSGQTSRYRLRCGYVDEFYSVAEFYFYAPAQREYTAQVQLGTGTQVDILAHNIDLHDMYKGLLRSPVKQRINTFDAATRDKMRAQFKAKVAEGDKSWLADFKKSNLIEYDLVKGLRPAPLTGEARQKRDDEIWYALPPVNSQTVGQYGTAPRGNNVPEAAAASKDIGQWTLAGKWDTRWELRLLKDRRDKEPVAVYTWEDLAAHKPLPEPWPFREDAGGITFDKPNGSDKYPSTLSTIAHFNTQRITDFTDKLTGRALHWAGMAGYYHYTGDKEAARDAAMALVRVAYLAPTWDESRLSVNAAVAGRTPDLNWGGKDQWTTRRLTRTDAGLYNQLYLEAYDRLFDYIKGNEELAQAAHRYIPWIKNAQDLQTFLDMNLLQYTAKRMVRWHLHHNDLMSAVMATGNTDYTRPWMDFLFRETYVYPQARAGMPDYAITSTQRDGTSYIGSWFYAMDGGKAMEYAQTTREYVRRSGDPKYDMSDFRRFPKALAGCNFQIEGRAAGLHPLGVGDVNGPNLPYGHWFTLGSPEHQARTGWRWSKDPKYAYILANYFSPKDETPEEWQAIQEAAKGQPNPWFTQRSRVLNNWAAILEGGTQHADFRFRRAAMLRVGYGWGHQHNDVLDLIAWCHGVIHAAVGGERPEQRKLGDVHEPKNQASYTHNMVEVDGDGSHRQGQLRGYSWVRNLKDADGVQYTLAEAAPGINHPYLSLYRRQLALVDINEGTPPAKQPSEPKEYAPSFVLPKVARTADAYLFDVFRVVGGRRHTYCFHGPEEDQFTTNVNNLRALGPAYGPKADTSSEAQYVRKFVVADSKTAGTAPKVLEATWRLQREGPDIELTMPEKDAAGNETPKVVKTMRRDNTEKRILGVNYDPDSPRKFTRLHLLEHEGGKVLTGKWVATSPNVTLQCLFAQRELTGDLPANDPGKLESAFPAIIEMYEDKPVIQSVQSLAIPNNEADALRAVAIKVGLPDGRSDICFSDGRPTQVRKLPDGLSAAGQFGFISTDAKGVRQMILTGGSTLQAPALGVQSALSERKGKIVAVDYTERKVVIEGMSLVNAALLKGAACEIGTPDHRTTYMIKDASTAGNRVTLTFDKGADFYSSRVLEVREKEGVVRCGLGFPTDDSVVYPGMSKDLIASNEQLTKFWRAEFLGGTREEGYQFKLTSGTGSSVSAADFGEKGGLRIWEFGVGDEVCIPTHVALQRQDEQTYLVRADTDFELITQAQAVEISLDGQTWQALARGAAQKGFVIGQNQLGTGKAFLRLR